jgi:hypothetical protein
MLPVDKQYYFIWDRIANGPYLAWKQDNEFWALSMDIYKVDRTIISSIPVVLPESKKKLNGWILSEQEKPFVKDMYEVSSDILAYDSKKNFICECFYTYGMSGSEWCDAESMGPYDRLRFDPDYWKPTPTIEEMEKLKEFKDD